MSLNETKDYKNNVNTSDSIGRCVVTVKNSTSNKKVANFVRARKAHGTIVLTAKHGEEGMLYNATVDKCGVITYTPLAIIPQEDIINNNINICRAFACSRNATCLKATLAKVGDYYLPAVDEKGILTYTPLAVAIHRLGGNE